MRIKILAASVAILFAQTIATAAPAPAPALMTPTGPWNVEFADSMCLLSRPYGKDRAINLILKPSMIGDGLEIIVTKATTSIEVPNSGKAVLAVAGGPAVADAYFSAYSTAKTRLLRINIVDDKIALSAVRGTLSIDAERESRHLFAISGIERALPVLSACLAQLRALYKVSAADMAAIVTPPKGKIIDYFAVNDYPIDAVRKGLSGTVGVLLWVEADGHISTCEIIESSAAPVLEQATCNVIKRRARLTAATDAIGNDIRAPFFYRVRWGLAP